MASFIFKILRKNEWLEAQNNTCFKGAPIDVDDGYIHFSTRPQLGETLAKYFADEKQLIVLAFTSETPAFSGALKWEPARGGALFPHLYRTLDTTIATRVWQLEPAKSGLYDLTVIDDWLVTEGKND